MRAHPPGGPNPEPCTQAPRPPFLSFLVPTRSSQGSITAWAVSQRRDRGGVHAEHTDPALLGLLHELGRPQHDAGAKGNRQGRAKVEIGGGVQTAPRSDLPIRTKPYIWEFGVHGGIGMGVGQASEPAAGRIPSAGQPIKSPRTKAPITPQKRPRSPLAISKCKAIIQIQFWPPESDLLAWYYIRLSRRESHSSRQPLHSPSRPSSAAPSASCPDQESSPTNKYPA